MEDLHSDRATRYHGGRWRRYDTIGSNGRFEVFGPGSFREEIGRRQHVLSERCAVYLCGNLMSVALSCENALFVAGSSNLCNSSRPNRSFIEFFEHLIKGSAEGVFHEPLGVPEGVRFRG